MHPKFKEQANLDFRVNLQHGIRLLGVGVIGNTDYASDRVMGFTPWSGYIYQEM